MWFGFGQTAARNFAKNPNALKYSPLLEQWTNTTSALLKPLVVDECPADWWHQVNDNSSELFPRFSTFDKAAWKTWNNETEAPSEAR